MLVLIRFLGIQRQITETDRLEVAVKTKARVADVLAILNQEYPDLPISPKTCIVTVNKIVASLESSLEDKDTISFLPYLAGG